MFLSGRQWGTRICGEIDERWPQEQQKNHISSLNLFPFFVELVLVALMPTEMKLVSANLPTITLGPGM